MNASEAKVPNIERDWQSIEIYLFSNGQQNSPPRKYHLRADELNWWDATLNHLARSHYGLHHPLIYLYTMDGRLVEGPLELRDGHAYVAVQPEDSFIDAGYQKYLIKASRSWEKRQAKKRHPMCDSDQPCCSCPEKQVSLPPEFISAPTGPPKLPPDEPFISPVHTKSRPDKYAAAVAGDVGVRPNENGSMLSEKQPQTDKDLKSGEQRARPEGYEPSQDKSESRPDEHTAKQISYGTGNIDSSPLSSDSRDESSGRPDEDTDRSTVYGFKPYKYAMKTTRTEARTHESAVDDFDTRLDKYGDSVYDHGSRLGKPYDKSSPESRSSESARIKTGEDGAKTDENSPKVIDSQPENSSREKKDEGTVIPEVQDRIVSEQHSTVSSKNRDKSVGQENEYRVSEGESHARDIELVSRDGGTIGTSDKGSGGEQNGNKIEHTGRVEKYKDTEVDHISTLSPQRSIGVGSKDRLREAANRENQDKGGVNEKQRKPENKVGGSIEEPKNSDIEQIHKLNGQNPTEIVHTGPIEQRGQKVEQTCSKQASEIQDKSRVTKEQETRNRDIIRESKSTDTENTHRSNEDGLVDKQDKDRIHAPTTRETYDSRELNGRKEPVVEHKVTRNTETSEEIVELQRSDKKSEETESLSKIDELKKIEHTRRLSGPRTTGYKNGVTPNKASTDGIQKTIISNDQGTTSTDNLERMNEPKSKKIEHISKTSSQNSAELKQGGTPTESIHTGTADEPRGKMPKHTYPPNEQRTIEVTKSQESKDDEKKSGGTERTDNPREKKVLENPGKRSESKHNARKTNGKRITENQESTVDEGTGGEADFTYKPKEEKVVEIEHAQRPSGQRTIDSKHDRTDDVKRDRDVLRKSEETLAEIDYVGRIDESASKEINGTSQPNGQTKIKTENTIHPRKENELEQTHRTNDSKMTERKQSLKTNGQRADIDNKYEQKVVATTYISRIEKPDKLKSNGHKAANNNESLGDEQQTRRIEHSFDPFEPTRDENVGKIDKSKTKKKEQIPKPNGKIGTTISYKTVVEERSTVVQKSYRPNEQRATEVEYVRKTSVLQAVKEIDRKHNGQRIAKTEQNHTPDEQRGREGQQPYRPNKPDEFERVDKTSEPPVRETENMRKPNGKNAVEIKSERRADTQRDGEAEHTSVSSKQSTTEIKHVDKTDKLKSRKMQQTNKPNGQKVAESKQGGTPTESLDIEIEHTDIPSKQTSVEGKDASQTREPKGKQLENKRKLSDQSATKTDQRSRVTEQKSKPVTHRRKSDEQRATAIRPGITRKPSDKPDKQDRLDEQITDGVYEKKEVESISSEIKKTNKVGQLKGQEDSNKDNRQRGKEFGNGKTIDEPKNKKNNQIEKGGKHTGSNSGVKQSEHSTKQSDPIARLRNLGVSDANDEAEPEKLISKVDETDANIGSSGVKALAENKMIPEALRHPESVTPGTKSDIIPKLGEPDKVNDTKTGENGHEANMAEHESERNGNEGTIAARVSQISEAQQHIRRNSLSTRKPSIERKRWSGGQNSTMIRRPTPPLVPLPLMKKTEDKKPLTPIKEVLPKKVSGKVPVPSTNDDGKTKISQYPQKRIIPPALPLPTTDVVHNDMKNRSNSLTKIILSNQKNLVTDSAPVENVIGDKEIISEPTNLSRDAGRNITSVTLDSDKHTANVVEDSTKNTQTETIGNQESRDTTDEGAQTHTKIITEQIETPGQETSILTKPKIDCNFCKHCDNTVATDAHDNNYISILKFNKGDFINLKLNIEVRNGRKSAHLSCQNHLQKSRSFTKVTTTDKGSQITIDDVMYLNKSLQSLLNNKCFRDNGLEDRPKVVVVQCGCCGTPNNPPQFPLACSDSKKYFILLPTVTDERCNCEPPYQEFGLVSQYDPNKLIKGIPINNTYTDMTLETVILSEMVLQKKEIEHLVTATSQTEDQQTEALEDKPKEAVTERSISRYNSHETSISTMLMRQIEFPVTKYSCPQMCPQTCSQTGPADFHLCLQFGPLMLPHRSTKTSSQEQSCDCPQGCSGNCLQGGTHGCSHDQSQSCSQARGCQEATSQDQSQKAAQPSSQVEPQGCQKTNSQVQSHGCQKPKSRVQSQGRAQPTSQVKSHGCQNIGSQGYSKLGYQVESYGCQKTSSQAQSNGCQNTSIGHAEGCSQIESYGCQPVQSHDCRHPTPQVQPQRGGQPCSQVQSHACPQSNPCSYDPSSAYFQACTPACARAQDAPSVFPQMLQPPCCPPMALEQSHGCASSSRQGQLQRDSQGTCYPGISRQVSDSGTQTQWCNTILEARRHDDGRYSLHLPPLQVLKFYTL